MNDHAIVWAVESEPDDNHYPSQIHAVFEVHADAKRAAAMPGLHDDRQDDYQVRPIRLYRHDDDPPQMLTRWCWECIVRDDGTTGEPRLWNQSAPEFNLDWAGPLVLPGKPTARFDRADLLKGKGGFLRIYGRTEAETVEHARKVLGGVAEVATSGKAQLPETVVR